MRIYLHVTTCLFCLFFAGYSGAQDVIEPQYDKDQQLVIASFQLDVERVTVLLAEGANPDSRLGFYDKHLFQDKWTLGSSHIGSEKWTPLLALANSHRAPEPETTTNNSSHDLEAARSKLKSVDSSIIAERDTRRVAIAKLLIAANANIDLGDDYGATALSASVYNGFENLALLLISSNAQLNTKTGVYIDGEGDIAPVHRASANPKILEAMIKRGADVAVADTSGRTPLHYAVLDGNGESVKLLLDAGANALAPDKAGRTSLSLGKLFAGLELPDSKNRKEVSILLDEAVNGRR